MEQLSTNVSGREDYFRFLDLPAELRNRIYDLAAETQADQPRCVLPCLTLAQTCQQVRTEYRPICMKRDIVIDWHKVPGYMRLFFPTVNGKIENIELAPSSMTIVTPWRGENGGSGLQLDILPMIKIGLCQPNFTCHFIHDIESLEEMEVFPYDSKELYLGDIPQFLEEDTASLRIVMGHRSEEWTSDIETGRITKILLSAIGVCAEPQALFYVNVHGLGDDMEKLGTTIEEAYFTRVGLLNVWSGDFDYFPALKRVG